MHRKFKKILTEYKKESTKIHRHSSLKIDKITKEAWKKTYDILKNDYLYRFHKKPENSHVETINLVHHYVSEAVLPPIIEKLEEEIIINRRKHDLILNAIETMLEILSDSSKSPSPTLKKEKRSTVTANPKKKTVTKKKTTQTKKKKGTANKKTVSKKSKK